MNSTCKVRHLVVVSEILYQPKVPIPMIRENVGEVAIVEDNRKIWESEAFPVLQRNQRPSFSVVAIVPAKVKQIRIHQADRELYQYLQPDREP